MSFLNLLSQNENPFFHNEIQVTKSTTKGQGANPPFCKGLTTRFCFVLFVFFWVVTTFVGLRRVPVTSSRPSSVNGN